ncbi:MAG: hypothetical protein JO000_16850, partial [Alphaproteobacteria bacterium]|nr:hypothetical protein [Alphaproteobacteria bacterium]
MWHDAATAQLRTADSAIISVQHDFALHDAGIGLERAELCRNCGCDAARRRFKRRDLCGKCFYLFEYIRSVERWDRARPETLKNAGALRRRYGADALPTLDTMSDEGFAALKSSIVGQLTAALRALRAREARRRGDVRVDGLTIEQKLKDILRVVQLRDKYDRVAGRFNGVSTVLNQSFSPEQCRILYSLLDDIEEQTYGQVTESHKAFEAVYQQRHAETPTVVPQAPQPAPAANASTTPGGLWLVDFKHRFRSGETALLVVDAHTQAVVASGAFNGNGFDVLQERLADTFRSAGVPGCVLVRHAQPRAQLTTLDVWLIEHDIAVGPSARQPKEIFAGIDAIVNRLRGDLLGRAFVNAQAADAAIAAWCRAEYAAREAATTRAARGGYLEQVVPFDYEPHDIIRRVQERGRVSLFGRIVRVPKALRGK